MKNLWFMVLFTTPLFADEARTHPSDTWEWTLESGYLWKIRDNSPLDYEIIPTQLTLRSPVIFTLWEDESGQRIVVRNRFAALAETITQGPEDYYFGLSAAPSVEYWFPSEKTSLFFSVGGGFGWLNSAGGVGGQGQDLTFNWFSQLGIRQQITENVSLLAGGYFVHHSNLGMTDPNPGIDALGFTIGCSFKF
jgi:lipid A 3-O-deacylase